MLKDYAVSNKNSKGRVHKVTNDDISGRDEFQRDFNRVINSISVRKLRQKTQVYTNSLPNDFYRSRLDHSMEVAEVAKSITSSLGLNSNLASVLGISHDLGHAPFGHLGQDILNGLMKEHGGFEHNIQSLRIVDELELAYYPIHKGLNLMYESREGLLKHCSKENAKKLGDIASRHLNNKQATLEAQIVDWSDAFSYLHSDLEDAFSFKILTPNDFENIPGFMKAYKVVQNKYGIELPTYKDFINPKTFEHIAINKGAIKYVINHMLKESINDLINTSKLKIESNNIKTLDDVRNHKTELITLSDKKNKEHYELKSFSKKHIYDSDLVIKNNNKMASVLKNLFYYYDNNIELLKLNGDFSKDNKYTIICDYISGMTDNYAITQNDEIVKYGKILSIKERYK